MISMSNFFAGIATSSLKSLRYNAEKYYNALAYFVISLFFNILFLQKHIT
jgi:hypothetical protein